MAGWIRHVPAAAADAGQSLRRLLPVRREAVDHENAEAQQSVLSAGAGRTGDGGAAGDDPTWTTIFQLL